MEKKEFNPGNNYQTTIKENYSKFLQGKKTEDCNNSNFIQKLSNEEIKENYKKYLFPIITESKININQLILLFSGEEYENISGYLNGDNNEVLGLFTKLLIEAFIEYYIDENIETNEKNKLYEYFLNNSINGTILIELINWKDKFKIIGTLLNNRELNFLKDLLIFKIQENILREINFLKDLFIYELKKDINGKDNLEIKKIIDEINDKDKIKFFNKLKIIGLVITYNFIRSPILEKYKNTYFDDLKLIEIHSEISKICSNQFLKYLNDGEFQDFLGEKANDFESIDIRKYYSKIKVPGNNIGFNSYRYGSTLQVAKDYISFSSSKISKGLSKYNKETKIEETEKKENDTYRLYYNILEIFFEKEENIKDKFTLENKNFEELDLQEKQFNLGKYAKDFLLKIIYYYNDNTEKNINRFKYIFTKLFGEEIGTKLTNFIINFINEINNSEIKGYDFLAKFKIISSQKEDKHKIYYNEQINILSKILNGVKINKIEDNRIKLNISQYQEIIKQEDIDIFQNIDLENLALLLESFHEPKILVRISNDLGYDITNLTLQNQIHLIRFLWEQSPEEFEKFKKTINEIEDKNSFLTTFLACSEDINIGNKIIELAKYPGSEEIFEAYAQLVNLQSEVEGEEINTQSFLKSILSRGRGLLEEAHNQATEENNGEKLIIDKKYSTSLVKSGAFMKAMISKQKKGEVLGKEEFNEKSPDFYIETFEGSGGLIKSDEKLDMLTKDNYTNPDIFGIEDYKMIVRNLQETYSGIDEGWLGVLIRNIVKDLKNPQVTFYLMRSKKDGKLLSLCKSKNIGENELYLGTHYVEPEYRKDFGFGEYILKLAIQENKKTYIISGSVAINNPSLERHINYGGFIASNIIFESDEQGSSRELFKVDIIKNKIFKTKNKKKYPDEKIKSMVGQEIEDIVVVKMDSQVKNDKDFIEVSKKHFKDGYYLTRLFYEKDSNENISDLSQTYMVFEKNEEL